MQQQKTPRAVHKKERQKRRVNKYCSCQTETTEGNVIFLHWYPMMRQLAQVLLSEVWLATAARLACL